MSKLKIAVVLGTRPEIIRLSRVLYELDQYTNLTLIHTGQNYDYELNEVFFNDLELRKPDYFLDCAVDSATSVQTIGNILIAVDRVFDQVNPDALLVLGDTNSCLSVISAKRKKIPIFHMEAGNRCFDQRVPEETNRRIVDHTSDVNLPYSTIARSYLINEGLPPDRVIVTGSPMFEVLSHYSARVEGSTIIEELELGKFGYFLVSAHREENIDSAYNFNRLITVLNSIADVYSLPVIVSTHPRTQKNIDKAGISFHPLVKLIKPVGFIDYLSLQLNSKVVLSDSGTITEESSILNFPALNIREAHERPEGMEQSSVMMVGLDLDRVHQGISILEAQCRGDARDLMLVEDYSKPNVSKKVLRIIVSYVDYVKRVVWKEYGQHLYR